MHRFVPLFFALSVLVSVAASSAEDGQVSFERRVKDSFTANATIELHAYGQLTHALERPFRFLASANSSVSVDLTEYLKFSAELLGVLPLDIATASSETQDTIAIEPHFLAEELALQWHNNHFNLSMGRLLVPWRGVLGVELNNRLNPIDYRRGSNFTSGHLGRIPQWGFDFQTDVDGYLIQWVAFVNFLSSQGPLFASEQGGFKAGQYQGSLFRSFRESENYKKKSQGYYQGAYYFRPSFALLVSKDFGGVDVGLNMVYGNDSMPRIFSKDFEENPYFRQLSFGFDFTKSFDYFLLKGEAVYVPRVAGLGKGLMQLWQRPDKNTEGNYRTIGLAHANFFAIGAEASIGNYLEGGISVLTSLWWGLPNNVAPLGVEGMFTTREGAVVGRVSLVLVLKGEIGDMPLSWNLQSEVGIWRPDIALHFDMAYEFEKLGLSVGLFIDSFFGFYGTPAWMRHGQNAAGFFVSQNL